MAVVIASDLAKDIAGAPLLRGVSFALERRDRMTIAGRNGAGKTTLLRMLAGEASIDGGELSFGKGVRIALHDQRPPRERDLSLRDYVLSGCAELVALEAELADLEAAMAAGDAGERTLGRYADAQAALEHAGGYTWRDQATAVVRGLGFADSDLDRPLRTFSGGELTRGSLARVLASRPDLLLLDEPTNHLDIASLEWLEATLVALDAAVVLVAHDRWFLEAVGTSVLELEAGRSRFFAGPWHAWRKEKAARELALGRAIERQEAEIARLERFVTRFRAGTRARQAQSRVKRLDKIERVGRDPQDGRALEFAFKPPERSGRVVFELQDGAIRAGDRQLLTGAELWLERGEHVALVGSNGSGKTTLIDTLTGRRALAGGTLRTGHNVTVGYLSQHADELDDRGSVLEACQKLTGLTPNKARALLGQFLFSGEEAEKPVAGLSGGERRRLSLAALVHSGANVLVLDEPTNHLDVESREALEDALQAFPGAVLLVSHDRALLDAVGSRAVAVEDGTLHSYVGGWTDAVRGRDADGDDAPGPAPAAPARAGRRRARGGDGRPGAEPGAKASANDGRRGADAGANGRGASRRRQPSKNAKRQQAAIEAEIAEAESALAALEAELAGPEAWATPERSADSSARHRDAKRTVEELYARYERLAG